MIDIESLEPGEHIHRDIKVIVIGATDDVYTLDPETFTVEIDNEMSDDSHLGKVSCGECDEEYEFDWDDTDDPELLEDLPEWARAAIAIVRKERGLD